MYDVLIIGAGVIGGFVAKELSRYNIKTIILDKENDVGNVTSAANSAIIHSGYDPFPGTNKAKHNIRGSKLYEQICQELDVEFKRVGSLTCATEEEQIEALHALVARAKENNVEVKLLDKEETKKQEPFINDNVIASLYAPTAAIVNPFELCVAIVENAVDNGVTLKLNEEVTKITKKKDYYIVKTKDNTYEAKVVVNAAGLYSDEIAKMVNLNSFKIRPRKGEYIVLDHFEEPYVSHVLFPMPSNKGKGIMMAPTTHNNYLVGASSDFIDDKGDYSTHKETIDEIISSVNKMVSHLPLKRNIRQFSGLRSTGNTGDFIIEEKDGFIILGAIESPGLAAAPSIALEAVELVSKTLDLNEKENYNPKRRKVNRLSKMGMEERNKLIKENPSYGRIICRCEQISEGEVIDSIRRNAGATTVKGVKKRCRPGFGLCQGGFCEPRVIEILARELNKDMLDIRYDGLKSYILKTYSKESGDTND